MEMKMGPIFPFIYVLVAASVGLAVQEKTVNLGLILRKDSKDCHKISGGRSVDLLANDVVALIQTHTSEAVPFVSGLGEAANVPILSLSVSNPALCKDRFPYFVCMAHSDRIQMKAFSTLPVKHYGWRSIAFLHSDHDFGSGAVSALREALRDLDSEIISTLMIPSTAQKQTIREETYKLKTIKSSVFVVHTPCALGMNLFMEAQETGMMNAGYVWITTQEFTSL
ncbi:hypothetical protein SUGI_0576920 [Cryptomeria japonica]|nr:hypothetical protein SUGI_0576920 [Cryptomeria japonica]